MTTRLALLVPAYNAASYLPRLLGAAAVQTRRFDEILVYDDCSTDNTAEVAASLGATVVRGDVNRGCAYGKNILAGRTTCEWLHFHDADDEMLPGFVQAAHRWIEQDKVDVVAFGCVQRDEATGEDEHWAIHSAKELADDPVRYTIRNKINSISGIYRRSAFVAAGGYDTDPAVLYNEDVAMHCALARAGLRFSADEAVLIVAWRRPGSMSNANRVKCIRAQHQVLLKARANDTTGKYSAEIADRLWEVAADAATHLDWPTADACSGLAMQLGGSPRAETRLFRTLCWLGPQAALRLREGLIRLLKPAYRSRNPGWRRGHAGTKDRKEGRHANMRLGG